MSNEYELWECYGGSAMWGVPNRRRMHEICHGPSVLQLRFSAVDWESAKRIKERFLFEGNPDGLIALNIPAEDFFTTAYRCGLHVGDRLTVRDDYPLLVDDWAVGFFPKGTVLEVTKGDREYPEWVFVSVVEFPRRRMGKVTRFEIHERDFSAGLFKPESKDA